MSELDRGIDEHNHLLFRQETMLSRDIRSKSTKPIMKDIKDKCKYNNLAKAIETNVSDRAVIVNSGISGA